MPTGDTRRRRIGRGAMPADCGQGADPLSPANIAKGSMTRASPTASNNSHDAMLEERLAVLELLDSLSYDRKLFESLLRN